ncbi:MAG: hypothetical protein E7235_06150, partial [Lachnospiraceae bacterium]|nr:hypothetical protein [Lachnospiraceae bacterium]
MAKKRNTSTLFIFLVFVLSVVAVIRTTTNDNVKRAIAYINDGWVSWDDINTVSIYSDGYYGRNIDEPIIITEKKEVKKIVKSASNANDYRQIPEDEYLEGLCGIFVDFGNGCVISMYNDVNYGTIDSQMQVMAEDEGYFYFPEGFYD